MKVKVNQEACIGCGACLAYDDLFEFDDEGLSKAKVEEVPEDRQDAATEASEGCPTGAISVE